MAFKRVDHLLDQIKRILRGLDQRAFTPDDILDALTESERNLCRKGNALRSEAELTTLAGVAKYNVAGLVAVIAARPPARWSEPLTVVSNDGVWADLKTRGFSGSFPLYIRGFAETIHFLPAPSIAGEKVELDLAHYPSSVRLEPGTDPEVTMGWEPALKMGALAELLGGAYIEAAERALALAVSQHSDVVKGVPQRDHWSRTLGF